MTRFFPILAVCFLVASSSFTAQGQVVTFNDIARFVSAKPLDPTSPLNQLSHLPSVQHHMVQTNELSQTWENSRLRQIRDWSRLEIHPHIARPQVVKYMFGGPDFVHVNTLFPGISQYVLVGLEPLGTIPDLMAMDPAALNIYLQHLHHTLRSISRRNFFITKEMREDFGHEGVDGVFPVLLYFASITGHGVLDAQYVKLDAQGQVVTTVPSEAQGLWFKLRDEIGGPGALPSQDLYYFKTDLSNAGFKAGSPFQQFLSARPGGIAYVKAASYLMHTDGFTNIRNFLAGDAQYILQDESGIPVDFLSLYFNLSYYGNYVGPIDSFLEHDQPTLHEVYRSGIAKPLPFGTGYRMKDSDSVQMFGVRK